MRLVSAYKRTPTARRLYLVSLNQVNQILLKIVASRGNRVCRYLRTRETVFTLVLGYEEGSGHTHTHWPELTKEEESPNPASHARMLLVLSRFSIDLLKRASKASEFPHGRRCVQR